MAIAIVSPLIDSLLDAVNTDTNFGTANPLYIGVQYAGPNKAHNYRTIMNFDVSALAGALINGAELHRPIQAVVAGGFAAHLGRCTRPWTNNGVTWNKYDGTNAWTTAGGDIDGALDLAYTEATTTPSEHIITILSIVTDAIANRNGIVSFIMRQDTNPGVNSYIQFDGIGFSNPSWLSIDYTSSTSISLPHRHHVLGDTRRIASSVG